MSGKLMPPFKENEQKKFTEKLCAAECEILKVVDFKLDMELAIPFDYIRRFARVLYESIYAVSQVENLSRTAQAIGNDSFLTEVNL